MDLEYRHQSLIVLIALVLISTVLLIFRQRSFPLHLRTLLAEKIIPVHHLFEDTDVATPAVAPELTATTTESTVQSPQTPSQLQLLEEENLHLRILLDLKKSVWKGSVVAQTIYRDPKRWFQEIMIDKGSNNRIETDDAVVARIGEEWVLIGRIVQVEPAVSKVMLLQDSLSAVAAMTEGENPVDGVMEGTDRDELRLRYIPREAPVRAKDMVRTSGLGQAFPSGLLIGQIVEIGLDERQLFLEARVRPALQSQRFRFVFVLPRSKKVELSAQP